jgi:hypothetical protein
MSDDDRIRFLKVISDPATHIVLGGTIVGHRASELIGILAFGRAGTSQDRHTGRDVDGAPLALGKPERRSLLNFLPDDGDDLTA